LAKGRVDDIPLAHTGAFSSEVDTGSREENATNTKYKRRETIMRIAAMSAGAVG
jgi:hypothetical protein